MASVNYATQYCQALSQQYPYVLRFGALYARNQEGDYRWVNVRTIEVPSVQVTGRFDGSRTTFFERRQRHSNSYTPLTLRNHRAWGDFIHPIDINETNQVLSIQNLTRTMNEQEKFPEMDRYLISTVYADWLEMGRTPLTAVLTTANILTYFDHMMEMMTERHVPLDGRILYITPPVNTLLKGATAWARHLNVEGTAPASVQRALTNIDNVSIEEVPTDIMQTAFDFTEGSKKGASAKPVLMFLIHPTAVITPNVYDFAKLDPPSAGSQGKWEYWEESYEDVFILPNKQHGIEFLIGGLTATAATFSTAAGETTNGTKLTVSAPTGGSLKKGTRYFYAAQASTPPQALAFGELAEGIDGWTEWDGESEIITTNEFKMTLLVCDADSRVYASGTADVTAKTD